MRHVVVRDERGLASGFADENGAVVAEVERDERGAFVGVILREADPGPALASAEDLEQLSRSSAAPSVRRPRSLRSRSAHRTAQPEARRRDDAAGATDARGVPGPLPAALQRLGNRRDASELHLGLLGAVTAFGQGDLVRAVGALRAIEGAP